MNKKLTLLSIATATVLFTGCGGGGGGGGSSTSTSSNITVSGKVVDPEIVGATVTLDCGSGNTYSAYNTTTSAGAFSIPVPTTTDLSQCTVLAVGGEDAGDDLTGLTLKAPYSLYNSRNGIYVTPITNAVAEYDTFSTNPQGAKSAVATFFGITESDLTKNPVDDVNLAKKTKKITKIAMKRNGGSTPIGYIDIDDNSKVTQATFDQYITTDVSSQMTADEKTELDAEIADVDASSDVNDLKKRNLERNLFKTLKADYKFTTNTNDAKLQYMAKKIVEASTNTNTYDRLTKRQVRKAKLDLGMSQSFKIENGTYSDTLVDSLTAIFAQDINTFKTTIDSKSIAILNLNQTYQDPKTYSQVVGNDNATRINYYQTINNSNIAKAHKLTEGSNSDAVLDPINAEVSNAMARLGAYDEALENIRDNVYTRSELQEAYRNLGKTILQTGEQAKAADAYYQEYLQLKAEIISTGEKLISNTQLRNLQTNARNIGLSNDPTRANENINYMIGLTNSITDPKYYLRIPVALKDLAIASYSIDNKLANAKQYINSASSLIENIPNPSERTAVFNTLNIILQQVKFGEFDTYNNKLTTLLNKYDADGSSYSQSDSFYMKQYIATRALSNNTTHYQAATTDFNALTDKNKRPALTEGYAAAMVINGDINSLFTNIFTKTIFPLNIDDVFKYHLAEKERSSFYTIQTLRARERDDLAELFLDKLDTLADDATSSDSAKTWNPTETDLKNLYGVWGTTDTFKTGYIKMAEIYKDLNKTAKAEAAITKAINKVILFTDLNLKIEAIMNLLTGTEEIGLQKDSETTTLVTHLENAAKHADMDDIDTIIKAANLLSKYNKKAEAKVLVDKAYGLVDTKNSGDLVTVKKRVERLVGKDGSSTTKFEYSITNGYLQAGDKTKANDIITEALTDIESLTSGTTDQYKLYRDISNAYAGLNDFTSTKTTIDKISVATAKKEHEEAKVSAAKYFANYDAFGSIKAASVDSDGDGKPDFWNHGVSASDILNSGLILDEDIDNDGIDDTTDTLPYDKID